MTKEPYWYLATPYSKYAGGLEAAFAEACKAAASLVTHGIRVYSPIAHTHPIAMHGNIDPLGHEIWVPADAPFMHNAVGFIVVKMAGWAESFGIGEEITMFRSLGKPILYMEWPNEGA